MEKKNFKNKTNMKNRKRYTQDELELIEKELISRIPLDKFSKEPTRVSAGLNGSIINEAIGKWATKDENDPVSIVAKELQRTALGVRVRLDKTLKEKGYIINYMHNKEYK
jgi:hypothetical protein